MCVDINWVLLALHILNSIFQKRKSGVPGSFSLYSTNGATIEHEAWCINCSTIITISRAGVKHNNYAMYHFLICLLCLQSTLFLSFRPYISRVEIMKIRWRGMIGFMPQWLHPWRKNYWYLLDIRWAPEAVWMLWRSVLPLLGI